MTGYMTLALLCASSLLTAEPVPVNPADAWYEGQHIFVVPVVVRHGRMMKVGDTILGTLQRHNPDDHSPNLYVVAPGFQHHGPASTDFNLIVNELCGIDSPAVWDVYWALVLDPALKSDFTGERELLLAVQEGFLPDQTITLEDLPSVGFLRTYLHIDSLAGLDSYRHADGTLPRVIMVPTGMAVRASVAGVDVSHPLQHLFASGRQ
jgi:hypothetical protein